jgi:hypothetical protein
MRSPELSGIGDAKLYGPAANSFIGDIDATLGQQILDIPKLRGNRKYSQTALPRPENGGGDRRRCASVSDST